MLNYLFKIVFFCFSISLSFSHSYLTLYFAGAGAAAAFFYFKFILMTRRQFKLIADWIFYGKMSWTLKVDLNSLFFLLSFCGGDCCCCCCSICSGCVVFVVFSFWICKFFRRKVTFFCWIFNFVCVCVCRVKYKWQWAKTNISLRV